MARLVRLIAPVVLVVLAGLLLIDRPLEGQGKSQQPSPVTIAGPLPVPTTGTSTVSGNVTASQGGSWTVGITGTPNINVLNWPSSGGVESSGEPVNYMLTCGPTNWSGCGPVYYDVPAGKRLIIEYLSLDAEGMPEGDAAALNVTTIVRGSGAFFFLPSSPVMVRGNSVNSQTVRLYADPSTSVAFFGYRMSGTGSDPATLYRYSFAGRLIPVS